MGESSLLGSRERPHQESEDVVSIVSRNNLTSTNFFRAPTHGLERELRHILTCDPSCDGNVEKAIKSSRSEGGGTGL